MQRERSPPFSLVFGTVKKFENERKKTMTYSERINKEIKTIAPRTFKPKLSDADVVRLYEKAGSAGLTPEQLFEQFVADLVDGTYSGGSDKQVIVNEWFDRSDFSTTSYNTFCAYLIKENELEYFYDMFETVIECQEEMLEPTTTDDEAEYCAECIKEADAEIQQLYSDYCKHNRNHRKYNDELKTVFEYSKRLNANLSERAAKIE